MVLKKIVSIQFIDSFKLPPALAGGKGMNVKLALAKRQTILTKVIDYYS
jgi:hypothetical protein